MAEGLPLNLPDRDEALPDFDSKAAKVDAALSPVKEEPNPAEADEGGGEIDGAIKPGAAVKGARSKRGGGAKRPDVTGTPAPPAAVKTHGATVVGDSPLFSPVGHVAAAFAAAALMPEPSDRSEAAREFTRSMVDPLIASVRAQADPATRMEMINCAQGELARLATEMARGAPRGVARGVGGGRGGGPAVLAPGRRRARRGRVRGGADFGGSATGYISPEKERPWGWARPHATGCDIPAARARRADARTHERTKTVLVNPRAGLVFKVL